MSYVRDIKCNDDDDASNNKSNLNEAMQYLHQQELNVKVSYTCKIAQHVLQNRSL